MAIDAALSAGLIMLLLSSCMLTGQPEANGTMAANNTTANSTRQAPQNVSPAPPSNPASDWDYINKTNVEIDCMSEARTYATSQGFGPEVVYGCQCSANESDALKTYNCSISALDGQHPVEVKCSKDNGTCVISINGKSEELTIEQIYSIANG